MYSYKKHRRIHWWEKKAHLRQLNTDRCRSYYQRHLSKKAKEKALRQHETQARYEKKRHREELIEQVLVSFLEAQKQGLNEKKEREAHLL